MIKPLSHQLQHGSFPSIGSSHGDMATFALERYGVAVARQQDADTKAGARPDDPDGRFDVRRSRPDLHNVGLVEVGNRERIGSEVVVHPKSIQAEAPT